MVSGIFWAVHLAALRLRNGGDCKSRGCFIITHFKCELEVLENVSLGLGGMIPFGSPMEAVRSSSMDDSAMRIPDEFGLYPMLGYLDIRAAFRSVLTLKRLGQSILFGSREVAKCIRVSGWVICFNQNRARLSYSTREQDDFPIRWTLRRSDSNLVRPMTLRPREFQLLKRARNETSVMLMGLYHGHVDCSWQV